MMTNRQGWCGIIGWTARQFDAAIIKGFPGKKKTLSRGDIWQVDTCEAIRWVVAQEAPKHRPKAAKPDFSDPPPGWEAFRAAELVDDPYEAIGMVNLLWLVYALPRLVANMAFGEGVGIDKTWRISVGIVILALEHCRQTLNYWPKCEDAVRVLDKAFEGVNWPFEATKEGRPDWRPPVFGLGWSEAEPDYFAECVAHGEALDEKYRLLDEQDAAARAQA